MRRRNRWWIKTIENVPEDRIIRLKSQDGPIGQTWLGREFVRILEEAGEKGRLTRAKTCARKGSGTNLKIRKQHISIGICCSGYTIRDINFMFSELKDQEWDRFVRVVAKDAALTGALYSGDMSEYFFHELEKEKIFLRPKSFKAVYSYCNCGDSQNLCIHVAVAWYFFAEALDANPWHLLTLYGMDKETIINRVRNLRNKETYLHERKISLKQKKTGTDTEILIPKKTNPEGFFLMKEDIGSSLVVNQDGPEINPVLLLGPAPYTLGGKNLADRIISLYPNIQEFAGSFEKQDNENTDV
jgi:uncharacterized Zn finger protein